MSKKIKKIKKIVITDIIHEFKDGIEYDVFLNGKEIVKIEKSKE